MAILAMTGGGKTVAARRIISELLAARYPLEGRRFALAHGLYSLSQNSPTVRASPGFAFRAVDLLYLLGREILDRRAGRAVVFLVLLAEKLGFSLAVFVVESEEEG